LSGLELPGVAEDLPFGSDGEAISALQHTPGGKGFQACGEVVAVLPGLLQLALHGGGQTVG
jgi:hypothetical protein